jgi:hypothetical protein
MQTYLRVLSAEAEGAGWEEVARIVLRLDPARERGRARRAKCNGLSSIKRWSAFGSSIVSEITATPDQAWIKAGTLDDTSGLTTNDGDLLRERATKA